MWYRQSASTGDWRPDWTVSWGGQAGVEQAGTRGERAPGGTERIGRAGRAVRAEQMELAGQLARTSNTTRDEPTNGQAVSRRIDPSLARAFARGWAKLWVTTGPCQHFYRREFDLAHQRDSRLASSMVQAEAMLAPTHNEVSSARADVAIEQMCRDVGAWLDTVAATGDRGWRFRAARDAMSLVGNLSLLAIIAACFYREHGTGDDVDGADRRSAGIANTPFGVPWADWTLLAFEGAKGMLTQSLGSPTLIRHHAVDEVLKRMDAGCRLLEACVVLPGSASSSDAALAAASSPSPASASSASSAESPASSWRSTLGTLTRSRDVATLFTFANSAVPPARLGLWIPSWFSGASAVTDSYRGLLRVAGLMLDSCRAVTSLLGTWARNEAFTLDAQHLTQRWHALCERLMYVGANDRTDILLRVAHVAKLTALCDTPLLAKIASHAALRERLLASGKSFAAGQIESACQEFGVPCHASSVDGLSYLSLNPAESPWGHRWTDGAWQCGGATPVRASYRLLLRYQHWSAALLEQAVSASSCTEDMRQTQEAADSTPPRDDPDGVTRTRSGAVHIDIETTRL